MTEKEWSKVEEKGKDIAQKWAARPMLILAILYLRDNFFSQWDVLPGILVSLAILVVAGIISGITMGIGYLLIAALRAR